MSTSSKIPSYASASLYVGDLSSEVTEGMLFEIFNTIGPVASIRVCRDAVTRRSLGYAYVNFHGIVDAERALDQMNNTPIKGKLCRIMWSQRDPSARKSGSGNIFIKNLDKSIDHKTLYDTFSMFGTILSCKVVTDSNGESKGYGFVHYDSDEAAAKAIAKVNNMLLAGKTVFVAPFVPKKMREQQEGENGPRFTNLYVKNLPEDISTDDKLKELFGQYGTITSAWLATEKISRIALAKRKAEVAARKAASAERRKKAEEAAAAAAAADAKDADAKDADAKDEAKDEAKAEAAEAKAAEEDNAAAKAAADDVKVEGDPDEIIEVSRGFGFVNFETAEQAQAAVDAQNGRELDDGRVLFVGRAQKKSEREAELRKQAEQRKAERLSKYQGVNLYVKNLEDTVDDERLRDEFSQFGTITSCRVMRDDKSNSRGFGFVCFATSEEATRAVTEMNGKMIGTKPIYVALAQRKEERRAQLEMQHARRAPKGVPGVVPGAAGVPGMYAPNAPVFYAPGVQPPQQGFMYPQQMMQRNAASRQAWAGAPQQYPYVVAPGVPRGGNPGRRGPQQGQQRRGPQQQQQQQQQQQRAPQVNNDIAVQMQAMASAPLDPKRIADLPAEQQKLVLGEKLYPLIQASQPDLAGKITGMLLDSYFSEEIIHLIEMPDALAAKIQEALAVLEQHAKQQQQAQ